MAASKPTILLARKVSTIVDMWKQMCIEALENGKWLIAEYEARF
jgi:hypothetical protein